MKNIIICDLYGTLLKIDHEKLGISPLLWNRLIEGRCKETPNFLRKIFDAQIKSVELFEDSLEFLNQASQTHHLICMSNLSHDFVKCFTDFGLDKYMKPIFSCIEGCYKPQPLIYNKVLNTVENGQIIYMIGDSFKNDYQRPRKLGIKAYLKDSENSNKEKINPKHKVSSLLEFYNIIENI